MPTIQIQQHPNDPQRATLSFSHGTVYQIDITPPFDDQQEQDLEWYFEEHLKFPFTNQVKFKQIGDSIKDYGENLFEQVFGQRRAYADYQAVLAEQPSIEIIGSAAFHSLHWEALKDPDMAEPLAVRFNLTRQPISIDTQRQPISNQSTPILRVLLVTSRPNGKHDVAYRTISQPLLAAVQNSQLPVQIDLLRPATYQALIQHLENCTKGTYHILHFDVHGSVLDYASLQQGAATGAYFFDQHYGTTKLEPYNGEKAFLFLNGDDNKAQPIEATDLKVLLARHGIPVVVLNACQSAKQSTQQECLGSLLMQAGIQGVVAMAYSVTVSAATLFVKTLYEELLKHQDFNAATRRARFELHQDKNRNAYHNQVIALEDWLLPVSYQHKPIKLALRAFYAEEEANWYEQQTKQYQPPHTSYGFVGRDLDVLDIEKRLAKHNLLLIQGMGGAGKTTLLHHLMNWWQVTHFVEQVFYFGYDEKAYTRQQILHSIARQLFSEKDYAFRFQSLSETAQQAKLVQELRAQRHCLVLDNLESITGAALSIPHSLTANEQAEVKAFLHALIGGHTRVLLGSRGEEAWLQCPAAPYHLAGLDAEAASLLANKILERNNALHYRNGEHQQDLSTLLKLLAGFPLALEVVLANTKSQTPKQILQALQTGDERIDFASDDKTQSILRCIDYSHSALSANAQQLLLCLAPFKGVLYLPLLERYSEKLQAQPALANLEFTDWQTVLAELQNWGLISPHEMNGYFSLQPTLSYFLNHRLRQDETSLQAIHCAFQQDYDVWGNQLYHLMQSKDPQEKQISYRCTELEYENLVHALQLALTAQVSVFYPYFALSLYMDSQQEQQQCLELGEQVLQRLESYPQTLLQGQLGYEFAGVIYDIAKQQFLLKHYTEAEKSYLKALSIWQANKNFEESIIKKQNAGIYHQLGMVVHAQRQWQQAHDYYQLALQISIEFNDLYKQAITYHQLGCVAQAQNQWQQAHDYYQQSLQINIKLKDSYNQASTYHQLGNMALEQKQWQQARDYYHLALQISIEFKDHCNQAKIYSQLGSLAQQQNQWQQAHDYCQLALQISIEFKDHYGLAKTYHQLGMMEHKQNQWQEAQNYYLKALTGLVEFQDEYNRDITLRNLNILYHAHADNTLAARISTLLSITEEQALAILQQDLTAPDA
jgi:tetratricopeptide (TPR) repeat protein